MAGTCNLSYIVIYAICAKFNDELIVILYDKEVVVVVVVTICYDKNLL